MRRGGTVAAVKALSTGQRQAGDAGDRRQRFATKTQRADALEIVERGNLRGGVAGERQSQFVTRDSRAVVADADQLDAAFFELNLDRRTARI
ncbi:MAG: hypothetical protein AW12_03083 [Candidatus Accumulibacter sp. BA-94]|nr:MAG: hypothetical protein AW12_03083 [Candidatus Accumulibacter sp. BA-94]